jgi:Sec-independent protein secretion pathway component TatC
MIGGPMVILYFVGVALAKLVEGNAFIKREPS